MPDFEMLWDCPTCDTKKLLGKTHRHCPTCGAAQDPSKRYFPPAGEEIAVQDHVYVGADKKCAACDTPNAANAAFCTNCGSGMDGSKEVALKRDNQNHERDAAEPPKAGGGAARWIVAAVALLVVVAGAFFCVSALWTKTEGATAASHAWVRSIDVDEYRTVRDEVWCDETAAGSRVLRQWDAERGTRQVPDGEDCTTERVDNGDGTFRNEQNCTPKTRSEPVMAPKCDVEVERWAKVRTAEERGLNLTPEWPNTGVAACASASIGCQRDGARNETYSVTFRRPDGSTQDCAFPEPTWRRFEVGATYTASVGVMDGSLRCGALSPDDRAP